MADSAAEITISGFAEFSFLMLFVICIYMIIILLWLFWWSIGDYDYFPPSLVAFHIGVGFGDLVDIKYFINI
jgi:hypothetical protein